MNAVKVCKFKSRWIGVALALGFGAFSSVNGFAGGSSGGSFNPITTISNPQATQEAIQGQFWPVITLEEAVLLLEEIRNYLPEGTQAVQLAKRSNGGLIVWAWVEGESTADKAGGWVNLSALRTPSHELPAEPAFWGEIRRVREATERLKQ
jgi:hypothetical protein